MFISAATIFERSVKSILDMHIQQVDDPCSKGTQYLYIQNLVCLNEALMCRSIHVDQNIDVCLQTN